VLFDLPPAFASVYSIPSSSPLQLHAVRLAASLSPAPLRSGRRSIPSLHVSVLSCFILCCGTPRAPPISTPTPVLSPCSVVAILGTKYQSTAAPECLVRPVLRPALAILARGVHRLLAWAGFLAGRHRHSPALLFRAAECPGRQPQTTQDVGPRWWWSRSSPFGRLSPFVIRLLASSRSCGYRSRHCGPSGLKPVLLGLPSSHRDRLRVNVSAPAASTQISLPSGLSTTRENGSAAQLSRLKD
jgi:hypothetical protein